MSWQAAGPWISVLGMVGALLSAAAAWRSSKTARDALEEAAKETSRQRWREFEVAKARVAALGELAAETAVSLQVEIDTLFSMGGMLDSGAYDHEKERINTRISLIEEKRRNAKSLSESVVYDSTDDALADAITRIYQAIATLEICIRQTEMDRSIIQPQVQLYREVRTRPSPPIRFHVPRGHT